MRKSQVVLAVVVVLALCVNGHWPACGAQNADGADREEYEFVPDTSQWVMVFQGETQSIGKLDAAGNFIPVRHFFQLRRGQGLTMTPGGNPINPEGPRGVYEFRSGRLIPGNIDEKCNFVPTVGGRIIDFKDYRYSPKAPKIYNLPGKFVRKEKQEPK